MVSLSNGKTGRTTAVTGPEAMEQEDEEDVAAGIAAGAGKAGQYSVTGDHGGGNCPPDRKCVRKLEFCRLGINKYPKTSKFYVLCLSVLMGTYGIVSSHFLLWIVPYSLLFPSLEPLFNDHDWQTT